MHAHLTVASGSWHYRHWHLPVSVPFKYLDTPFFFNASLLLHGYLHFTLSLKASKLKNKKSWKFIRVNKKYTFHTLFIFLRVYCIHICICCLGWLTQSDLCLLICYLIYVTLCIFHDKLIILLPSPYQSWSMWYSNWNLQSCKFGRILRYSTIIL